MIKRLLIALFVIGILFSLTYKNTIPSLAGNICGGCGSCDDDAGCCCGAGNYVDCGCIGCGTSCGSSGGGCSNSSTCAGGTGFDCTTFTNGGACNTDWGNGYLPSTVWSKRVGIYNVNPLDTCSPKWPTWSNYGGQDDLVWRDSGRFTYSTNHYCDIPLNGGNHPIHWSDSAITTHTYINSNGRNCGGVTMYKCYGVFNVASGSYTKSAGSSRFSTMTVSGTAVFTQTGGDLIVGTCN